ncbi:MAG: CDP-glycerol--poly(glycerophosphate) glycerophosphotransferase [Lachnospiraceae bacterium]|nr:CDP-glycerol--poly(glycerophosphate) glycerophosphotransferase [Lachnospiraceae bacterium]
MKKKILKQYKKFRHSVRLALESNEVIDDMYLASKAKALDKQHKDMEINSKKIVFTNYMGRGYGCNCKYLVEEIISEGLDYELVWLMNENEDSSVFPKEVRLVNYKSDEALYELSTSKFLISNYHLNYFIKKGFRKKEEQVYIQMWHGSFGIKKIERHVPGLTESKMWTKIAKINSEMTDYWISNSDFESDIYKSAFWEVKNIQMLGHPRNDIFFKDNTRLISKVLGKYGVDIDKKIALYMPTFREDYRLDCYDIDIDRLCETLEDKFGGEWIVLLRLHPRIANLKERFMSQYHNNRVVDVTKYDDVQELIASADIMISDYSSCIFDYLLTKKPGFIYATDMDKYDSERGFYYSLYDTPFSICKNNEQLCDAIQLFDEDKYIAKVDRFLQEKGSIEDGNAASKLIEFIENL